MEAYSCPSLEPRVVSVELLDFEAFAHAYLCDTPFGGLVFDTPLDLTAGEIIELRLCILSESACVRLHGRVLWCRDKLQPRGVGVGFLASETSKVRRLLTTASSLYDLTNPVERSGTRIPTEFKVRYASQAEFVEDYVRNLSSGGLFIQTREPPDEKDAIVLCLEIPGEPLPIELGGQVVWRKPGEGFGVRFTQLESATQQRLEEVVRRLSRGRETCLPSPFRDELARLADNKA